MSKKDGLFLGHEPCLKCPSSDGMAVYEKVDENGETFLDGYCWVCDEYIRPDELGSARGDRKKSYTVDDEELGLKDQKLVQEIQEYDTRGIRERKIKKVYAEMYGMKVSYSEDTGEIDAHFYPTTKQNQITGFFKRELPKKFSAVGDVKGIQLQGQHLFDKGGVFENRINHKFIIVTEGFLDMLAAAQMMNEDSKYITPVVSLPNGANTKHITTDDNFKFLNRFENIILAFDQDDPGRKNAKEVTKIFSAGKVKVMTFGEKDPCDMNAKGKVDEFKKAFWKAAPNKPSQIVTVDDIFEKALALPEVGLSFPWPTATEKTLGIRRGEIHVVGAAPKIGKTEHQHQMIKHMTEVHGEKVGVMSLEENPVKTLKKVAGKYAGKQFTKPPEVGGYTLEELESAMNLVRGKIEFYSSDGVRDHSEILETVRYWASKGFWFFIVDPLTALVAEHSSSEANDILNEFMSKAASMAMELNITFFMYSHVNPAKSGIPHDQGGDVLSSQWTGSRAMEKWAHYGWGIQRDRTEKDPIIRNTARVTMLFDREFGEYCEYYAFYDSETNDWSECPDPIEGNGKPYSDVTEDQELFEQAPEY